MKKKRNLYIIAFLCFITLVGVIIAYLGSTSVLENIFESGTYKTITHEEFTSPSNWLPGDTTPKTITTTNEGTIPVMVRVKFDESWTSLNNDDLPLTYNDENVAIINLDNITDWMYKDGYYYYLSELAPGDTMLTTLDISSFDTSGVTNMRGMFEGSNLLETIYVSNKWNTSSVTDSSNMFRNCTSLPGYDSTKVDVSMANTNGGYLTLKSI